MSSTYPAPGFHFRVVFKEFGATSIDTKFQSVSGLGVSMQTETYREGAENLHEYTLPVRVKYNNLTLKRGLFKDSRLIKWCADTFTMGKIKPHNVEVILLNEQHQPLMTWKINQAWPVKWNLSDLNATQSQLAIETLELAYRSFTIE